MTKIINWIKTYTDANGGVRACRHGGCIEFADEFEQAFPGAQIWSLYDIEADLPLVASLKQVSKFLKEIGETDLSSFIPDHDVVKYKGMVLDAAGISSFESIAKVFTDTKHPHFFRTL